MDERDEQIIRLKESEQKLITKQEELLFWMRNFLRSFPFGLIMLEKDQRIKAINKIACEYFQYGEQELAKQAVSMLFPDIGPFEVTEKPLRIAGRKKSGETIVVEVFVNSLAMFGEDLLFITVQDVDEKHKLEQLRLDLLAMVSHDLRSPLASVRLMLEMLGEGAYGQLDEKGIQLVGQSVSTVEYLNSMVGNLLDSENVENGRIELAVQDTTIGSIIKKAVGAVEASGRSAAVSIETEFTNDAIKVDEDRLAQVLINLISNAIKFSPKDGKVIVIGGINGVDAHFQVVDSGPGVPEEQREAIFQRYRQLVQPGAKRSGFGLGLAICKALVEKHNGKIWVENGESNGSKFCFTVPMG